MGVLCAKTARAHWRQALMVDFVNNRDATIVNGVAKAIARCGDGVHDVRVTSPLWRVMSLITTTNFSFFLFSFCWLVTTAAVAICTGRE